MELSKISLIPTKTELFDQNFNQYENLDFSNTFQNANQYLFSKAIDLRAEFTHQIKYFINQLKSHSYEGFKVHDNVNLNRNILQFGSSENSQKFSHGSLLLIFTKKLEIDPNIHIFLAIVKKVQNNCEGLFKIQIDTLGEEPTLRENLSFLDTGLNFHKYQSILQSLQQMEKKLLPFEKYFVHNFQGKISTPKYLSVGYPIIEISGHFFNPIIENEWPKSSDLGFNDCIRNCLKNSITSEISLIRDLEIFNYFMSNSRLWKDVETGPILYIFKSYEMLDCFLKKIVNSQESNKNEIEISRIAVEPCRSRNLQKYMIQNQLKSYKNDEKIQIPQELDKILSEKNELCELREVLTKQRGILNITIISSILQELKEEFPLGLRSLLKNLKWLGLQNEVFDEEFSEEFLFRKWFGLKAKMKLNSSACDSNSNLIEEKIVNFEDFGESIDYSQFGKISEKRPLYYLCGFSLDEIDEEIREEENVLHRNFLENKKIFLEKMSQYYTEGRLNLLDDTETKEVLRKFKNREVDLKMSSQKEKFSIYFYILKRALYLTNEKIFKIEQEIEKNFKGLMFERNLNFLRRMSLIFTTDLGCAIHNELLKQLQIKIVIVEEATEISESNLVTVLSQNCQHLILIADIITPVKPENSELSMFEKLFTKDFEIFHLDQLDMEEELGFEKNSPMDTYEACGHQIIYDETGNFDHCKMLVEKTLPCGHHQLGKIECHEDKNVNIKCDKLTEKTLDCGHSKKLPCSSDTRNEVCSVYLNKILSCGKHREELRCSENPHEVQCRAQISLVLPACGHSNKFECGAKDKTQCSFPVKRKLSNCDHEINVKCFEKNNKFECYQNCGVRLECGHMCDLRCHKKGRNHEKYECRKQCVKKCPKGHMCTNGHFCFEKCPPCKSLCEKILTPCGHPCQEICSTEPCGPCKVIVSKMSPNCGHNQEIPCSENPRGENCQALVPARCHSLCGHTVQVECKISNTITPEECILHCTEPCGQYFENCTHVCVGNCQTCQNGRFHVKCQANCDRQLICGHICTYPCSSSCPPCREICTFKCLHSKCPKVCGEPCLPCIENCQWICEHKKCSKLCSEFCDRGPCNEPCKKKIPCGHPCVGLCGDPCPPLCRICNFDELTEIFLGSEDEDGARFIVLEDCSHTFEVSDFNKYMRPDEDGQIMSKLCPKCQTLIKNSKRYGNYLKQAEQDIVRIKEMVYGVKEQLISEQKQLVDKIKVNFNDWLQNLPELIYFILKNLIKEETSTVGIIFQKIDKMNLRSIDILYNHGLGVIKTLRDFEAKISNPEYIAILKEVYSKTFKMIIDRPIPYSNSELQDLDLEFDRIFDLGQAYIRRCNPNYGASLQNPRLFEQLLANINRPTRYNDELKNQVKENLTGLDTALRSQQVVTARERADILGAVNLRQGHWYKCPNGHIYLITECGQAMQEGRCNECGAAIGGGSHRLRSDNVATNFG